MIPNRRLIMCLFAFLACGTLTGCYRGYQMDVEQGNVITPEKIALLQLGMTRGETRFVLGTPLIKDPFHAHRWDYVYSLRDGSTSGLVQQHLSLVFKGDLLVNIRHNLNDIMTDGAN